MNKIYSSFNFGSFSLNYILDSEQNKMGLCLLPAELPTAGFSPDSGNSADMQKDVSLEELLASHRKNLKDVPEAYFFKDWDTGYPPGWQVEPLVLVSISGSDRFGFHSWGQTMRSGSVSDALVFQNQQVKYSGNVTIIETVCENPEFFKVIHKVEYREGEKSAVVSSSIINTGRSSFNLELLSSFTMGFISPFNTDDAPGGYRIHRFRSSWSSEGRHVAEKAEIAELEPSWCNFSVRSEKFGQLGSMPVRRWFPFAAVEDTQRGIIWGARIEAPGSWQMEFYRKDDFFHLSGGQADREYGHWIKKLEPGDTFNSDKAWISVTAEGIDVLAGNLLPYNPEEEKKLPDQLSIFNEWCTTWGKPSSEILSPLLSVVKEAGLEYFVIDAGWYADKEGKWEATQGDWIPSGKLFPEGLGSFCRKIRDNGLIPGLWFEPEVIGEDSPLKEKTGWLLKLDGVPIKAGSRYFLDFRNPEVRFYVEEKISSLIRICNLGYIKIDYNDSIGLGADGAESPGEALRDHLSHVRAFYENLKKRFPDIIWENCSSGGHRLEPAFTKIMDITSFSDAHETKSIPIIAANLQRQINPSESLIWAVLHPGDSIRERFYKLSFLFLGQLCISGDIHLIDSDYRDLLKDTVNKHKEVFNILRNGNSRFFGTADRYTYKKPQGWQAVLRESSDKKEIILVIHSFENPENKISIMYPGIEHYKLSWILAENTPEINIEKNNIGLSLYGNYTGAVIKFEK